MPGFSQMELIASLYASAMLLCLLFFFLAMLRRMHHLSSPTRIRTAPPAVEVRSLNHWTPTGVLSLHLFSLKDNYKSSLESIKGRHRDYPCTPCPHPGIAFSPLSIFLLRKVFSFFFWPRLNVHWHILCFSCCCCLFALLEMSLKKLQQPPTLPSPSWISACLNLFIFK